MAGEEIKKPEKKWNPNVKENNVELISNVTGKPVELVANEQSLPMSQKRKEKIRLKFCGSQKLSESR